MNQTGIYLGVFVLIAALTAIFLLLYLIRKIERVGKGDGIGILNQNLQGLQQNLNQRLDNANYLISQMTRELGQIQQVGSQLRDFQDFLKSPKLRGNLGEQGLKELLSQALPHQYFSLQHAFLNGTIVDAIITLDAGKIPVDAKFPLENFNQMLKAQSDEEKGQFEKRFRHDFKIHIEAISKKYINTTEGTVDFAFLYLPSESIYFEVINNQNDLFDYAASRKIIVSSPSSFFYYLRTIMIGLEGKRITEMSYEIIKILKSVKKENENLDEGLNLLNRHLSNSLKVMSSVISTQASLSYKIDRINVLEKEEEKKLIGEVEYEETQG